MSTAYQVPTFQDAYEHLLDVFGLASTTVNDRRARSAILQAFNDFTGTRLWTRYQKPLRIVTSARYTTGTVAYDHTGGASERMLTLTDGTWPDWAELGEVQINLVIYPIDKRVSDTVVTLGVDLNPGADIASGTTYAIQRDLYALPDDFYQMGRLVDVASRLILYKEPPERLMLHKRINRTTGTPSGFAIVPHQKFTGGLALQIAPLPTSARTLDAIYFKRPHSLRTVLERTGTVTTVAGSTAVVGAGTAFKAIHAGAVIRFGEDGSNSPTSLAGFSEGYYPYKDQQVIRTYTDATNLVLEQPATYSLSAVKFTISDPLDMEAGAQITYFYRLIEARFARLDSRKDATEREAIAELARLKAMSEDNREVLNSGMDGPYSLADVAGTVVTNP